MSSDRNQLPVWAGELLPAVGLVALVSCQAVTGISDFTVSADASPPASGGGAGSGGLGGLGGSGGDASGSDADADADADEGPSDAEAGLHGDWWNSDWASRLGLLLVADEGPVGTRSLVRVTVDRTAMVGSRSDGDDVRVVFDSGIGLEEVDRKAVPGSSWDEATTTFVFELKSPLAAGDETGAYAVYFGNAEAGGPPTAVRPANFHLVEGGETTVPADTTVTLIDELLDLGNWMALLTWTSAGTGAPNEIQRLGLGFTTVGASVAEGGMGFRQFAPTPIRAHTTAPRGAHPHARRAPSPRPVEFSRRAPAGR